MKLTVYLAQRMTDRYCDEILAEAQEVVKVFAKYPNIKLWSPAIEEQIPNRHVKLKQLTKGSLDYKWRIDKKVGLRRSHIIYDATGDIRSEGVGIERGHVRWYLWRPVVRRKNLPHNYSIATIEEDGMFATHEEAAKYINKKWNSRIKWLKWKLPHVLFGVPELFWIQLNSLWL